MKKLLSLILAVIFVLSLVTFAFAAVTVGGNIRLWWEANDAQSTAKGASTSGVAESDNSFKFDRFELIVAGDNNANMGFYTKTQFRNIRIQSDDDKLGMSSSSSSDIGGGDLRIDNAYGYIKNVFTTGDQFMVGAFDGQYPFRNGYGNAQVCLGLGDALKMAIVTGVLYQINQPEWDVTFGVVNAQENTAINANPYVSNSNDNTNGNGMDLGYDYALRVNWKPASVTGLKAGVGYQYVAGSRSASGTQIFTNPQDNYDTEWIVDCSYSNSNVPYSGMIEYASVNPTRMGVSQDSVTGAYVEGAYQVGPVKFYAGRGMSLNAYDATAVSAGAYGNIFGGCFNGQAPTTTSDKGGFCFQYLDNSYTVAGIVYPLAANCFLNFETVIEDSGEAGDGSGYIQNAAFYGLMFRYNF